MESQIVSGWANWLAETAKRFGFSGYNAWKASPEVGEGRTGKSKLDGVERPMG